MFKKILLILISTALIFAVCSCATAGIIMPPPATFEGEVVVMPAPDENDIPEDYALFEISGLAYAKIVNGIIYYERRIGNGKEAEWVEICTTEQLVAEEIAKFLAARSPEPTVEPSTEPTTAPTPGPVATPKSNPTKKPGPSPLPTPKKTGGDSGDIPFNG